MINDVTVFLIFIELCKRVIRKGYSSFCVYLNDFVSILQYNVKIQRWRNKVANTTMNLAAGDTVIKEIPCYILFLLQCESKYQAWTAYKEVAGSGNNAFKVGTYYHTDWMEESEPPLKVDGLNIDKVYENFVRQIAGDALTPAKGETLKQSVERDNHKQELQKQIIIPQTKASKEKQLDKQVQLNAKLKKEKKNWRNCNECGTISEDSKQSG